MTHPEAQRQQSQPRHWRSHFGTWHARMALPIGSPLAAARWWTGYARHRALTTIHLYKQAKAGWDRRTIEAKWAIAQSVIADYKKAREILAEQELVQHGK